MREVINYKPDIFTSCFCILALPVGHGCQYISSSCAGVSWLSSSLTFSLPRWPSFYPADSPMRLNVPMQNSNNSCPKLSEFFFGACNYCYYSFIIRFIYLYIIPSWSARTICSEPGAKMIR